MSATYETLTFADLAGGELNGQFLKSLEEVTRDLADPGKDPEQARTITLKIRFVPNDAGQLLIEAFAETKLARCKLALAAAIVEQGRLLEHRWRQPDLPLGGFEPTGRDADGVLTFQKRGAPDVDAS